MSGKDTIAESGPSLVQDDPDHGGLGRLDNVPRQRLRRLRCHAAEANVDRFTPGGDERFQVGRRSLGLGFARKPEAVHRGTGWPVGRSGQHVPTDPVGDRVVVRCG